MLFTFRTRRRALHVPVLLLVVALVILASGLVALIFHWQSDQRVDGVGVFSTLAGLGVVLLALTDLRLLEVAGEQVIVKNVYDRKHLPTKKVALGIRVRYASRGGPTYTVYALADSIQVDLAAAGSEKQALRLKARLMDTLLRGRGDASAAQSSEQIIKSREETWRRNEAQAKAYVADYYASGKAKKVALWVIALVFLYVLGMFAWFSSR